MVFSWALNAQKAEMKIGSELDISKKYRIEKMLGTDGQFIYIKGNNGDSRFIGKGLVIAKLDSEMNLVGQVEFKVNDLMKGADELDIKMVDREIYVFGTEEKKKENKIVNYRCKLDKQTMTFSSPEVLLDIDQEVIWEFDWLAYIRDKDHRKIIYSPDATKFAIIATLHLSRGDVFDVKQTAHVFNSKFEKIGVYEFPRSAKYKAQVFTDYSLDNNGNLCAFSRGYSTKRDVATETNLNPKSNSILQYFSNNALAFEFENFPIEYKLVRSKISLENNEIIIAGFYVNNVDVKNTPLGLGYVVLDLKGKVKKQLYKPFDSEYAEYLKGGVKLKALFAIKYGKLLSLLTISKIIMKKDGGAFILTEELHSRSHSIRNSFNNTMHGNAWGAIASGGVGTVTTIHDYRGYRLIFNVSDKDQIEWVTSIPSSIDFKSYIGDSYFENKGDFLSLIFIDHPKNIQSDLNEPPIFSTPNALGMSYVNINANTGIAERSQISVESDKRFLFSPINSCEMNGSTYFIGTDEWKLENRMAKISYK